MTVYGQLETARRKELSKTSAVFSSLQLNKHKQEFFFWMRNLVTVEKYGLIELYIVHDIETFKTVIKETPINTYALGMGFKAKNK